MYTNRFHYRTGSGAKSPASSPLSCRSPSAAAAKQLVAASVAELIAHVVERIEVLVGHVVLRKTRNTDRRDAGLDPERDAPAREVLDSLRQRARLHIIFGPDDANPFAVGGNEPGAMQRAAKNSRRRLCGRPVSIPSPATFVTRGRSTG